ncbi:MAG: type I-D CRISPR-associated helicase Cas3' [Chloroflexota bacterium]|nr:type I-D CRISPR-associated helicase Cas3' [Chloroflexota bacterium]
MLELTLAAHTEALTDPTATDYARLQDALNGKEPSPNGRRALLYHQWRTYQALRDSEIVVNSYNTGTGKTQAALLHLLDLGASYRQNGSERRANVLFIAPTNELLRQHEEDIRTFIANNDLPHRVLRLDAARIRELAVIAQGDNVKRSGDSLNKMLSDPGSVLYDSDGQRSEGDFPFVLVTNPDIFYYALYGLGNPHERRVLFRDFTERFNYTVVDEFHYYNVKQFANFLFFFTLLREWGHFRKEQRRVCLLTATPNPQVQQYLDRLTTGEGAINIDYVNPQAEPAGLARIPALAPIRLRLYAAEETTAGLVDLTATARSLVQEWLLEGRHGAFVSSALWRINLIYGDYGGDGNPRTGRLTGAERVEGRKKGRNADLLMATPTVDIGYNFDRPGKTRQSLDFLLYDANYADEFIQRLGRAGRVLGKAVTDQPSDVWAVVPDKLLTDLLPHAGSELQRGELAALVQQALPARNGLYGYIRSGAIAETFLPIYHYKQGIATADRAQAEALLASVQQIYDVARNIPFKTLENKIRQYLKMQPIIAQMQKEADSPTFHIGPASLQGLKLTKNPDVELGGEEEEAPVYERKLRTRRSEFDQTRQASIEAYYVSAARFNFRDSFDPPQTLVHDPQRYLAEAIYNSYAAFHIAQNYEARWSADAGQIAEWKTHIEGRVDEDVRLCCALVAPLEQRLTLWLHLGDVTATQAEWEDQYLYKPVAQRGFRLIPARDTGGKVSGELNDLLAQQYFVFYAAPNVGPVARTLLSLKKTTALFTSTLVVDFDSGTREYMIVLGTAALMVAEEPNVKKAAYFAQHNDSQGGALFDWEDPTT